MSQEIKVENVSMVFHGAKSSVVAIKDVDLNLAAGRFGAIIGPSGCGKSTLLRLIADIMNPTAGKISIGDHSPRASRKRHSFGFVFQAPTLLPWRTVRQNIELPLEVVGRDSARRAKFTTDDLIELVGLETFEDALPATLSGGMQQRVAIARALVLEPNILLLDEPFGALDEITRQRMNIELLRIWSESKTTALLVTHSIAEAVFMSDDVYIMSSRPGRITQRLSIPLLRPRTLDVMRTQVFFDCVNRVRDGLFGHDERHESPALSKEEAY